MTASILRVTAFEGCLFVSLFVLPTGDFVHGKNTFSIRVASIQ